MLPCTTGNDFFTVWAKDTADVVRNMANLLPCVLAQNQFWKLELYRVGSFAVCPRAPLPCRILRHVSSGPSTVAISLPCVVPACCRGHFFVVCPGGTEHGRGCLCRLPHHVDTRQSVWPRWRLFFLVVMVGWRCCQRRTSLLPLEFTSPTLGEGGDATTSGDGASSPGP
jgi:hypothetical protein